MTCGLTRQSLMNISSSWTNQQAITTKKPKPATLVPTKLNACEINAMTAKCLFCKDTKIEPGIPGPCVWCEEIEPAPANTVERFTIATLRYAGGAEHDVRYVSEAHYDAALGREAASENDLSIWKQKACEAAEREAALREELEKVCGDEWRKDKRQIVALQQRLTVAEQALKFYADGDHLLMADADAWDTCSGEPVNFLHDEAGAASVEDGSIAKAALKPAAEVVISKPPMTMAEVFAFNDDHDSRPERED